MDGDDDDGGGYTTVFLFLGSFCCYFVPVNGYNIHFHTRREKEERQKSFSALPSLTTRMSERNELRGQETANREITSVFSYSTEFQVKDSDEAYSISVYLLEDLTVVSVVVRV